ncbi:hypothetical protein [Acidithrix ferrooxidans]|uniref:Uncharacterized protein n=1 Tax=Acidithrix ferrooxidans TaxID=1280514 RepID=A0A0D8HCB0_9ACTN|nr:hypothetical protein [Acidithrix ferrooxidans]KJF15524.1 hypothetical protein AXFE_36360 [Acidithrix ferrooxidans]
MSARSPLRHDSVTIVCPVCGSNFGPSGRRTYCSDACRALAYRRRRDMGGIPPVTAPKSQSRREFTVYECNRCGTRSLGEQRCEDCHIFMTRVGIGGYCPSCDEPVSINDLLGGEALLTSK